MATSYQVTIPGRWSWQVHVLDCPTCREDRGLTFSTDLDARHVTASCTAGHVWDEQRVPGGAIRQLAIQATEGR